MEKQLLIKKQTFKFNYREDGSFWYLGHNEFDMFNLGYATDLTFYRINPNWKEVEDFIVYLQCDDEKIKHKISIANKELKNVFENEYQRINPNFRFDEIYFTLCNIIFEGLNETQNGFRYILCFNVESKSDPDFFSYDSWEVKFENETLIDAYKS